MSELTNALSTALYGRDLPALQRLLTGQQADALYAFPGTPLLVFACAVPDLPVACLNAVLERTSDLNLADHQGMTGLMTAAVMGRTPIVQRLLEAGASLHVRDSIGRTALHLSAIPDDVSDEVLRILLAAGADPTATAADGETPLHVAARAGRVAAIDLLLDRGVHVGATSNRGRTPLHAAAERGRDRAVVRLIDRHATVNAPDATGWTPLLLAIAGVYYATAGVLLDRGADVRAAIHSDDGIAGGATALTLALGAFDGLVLDDHAPRRAFDAVFLERLVRSGADVNASDTNGRTALTLMLGDAAVRGFLLSHGADPNRPDTRGRTALHWAAASDPAVIVEDLCRHGADLERTDADGATALLVAASEGRVSAMRALLQCGAGAAATFPDGRGVLHTAAGALQGDQAGCLDLLAGTGVDVNAADHGGMTPLHWAAIRGRVEPVRVLLARGADRALRTTAGFTALDFASRYHHQDLVPLLQDPPAVTPTPG